MSRFDFDGDDGDRSITWGMWMHNVRRSLASKKGQERLREFKAALEAVPGHRLVDDWIADMEGDVCAIGALAAYKRVQETGKPWAEVTADLNQQFHPILEPFNTRSGQVIELFAEPERTDAWETQRLGMQECGLNRTLAWYLAYQNDEGDFYAAGPEERWQNAYEWVCKQLGEAA
jgi:hypothetical protein